MRAEAAPAQTLARLNDLRMAAQRENNEGRHSRARRQFSRLLRRIADTASASPDPEVSTPMHSPAAEDLRELTVRTWIGLSFACVAGARWDEAMSALDAAGRACGPARPDLRSLVHRQRGVAYANVGRTREALRNFEAALEERDRLAPGDVIICLLNLALTHAHVGDLAAAERESAELLALADPARFAVERFMATYNAGMIAYLAGDLPRALATMTEADGMDVAVTRAPGWGDQGRVLLDAGLVDEAVDLLTTAVQASNGQGPSIFLAQIHSTLADAHLLAGRHEEAYAAARAARAQLGRRASSEMRDHAQLTVQAIRLARGDPAGSVVSAVRPVFERAVAQGSLLEIRARLLSAEALLADDPGAAARVLPRTPERLSASELLRWRRVRAETSAATGDLPRARRELRSAAADLQRAQAAIASLDLGTARARHTEPLVRLDLRLAMASGPRAVYDVTERWRAASSRLAAVQPPEDPVAAGLVARLRATHARLEAAGEGERSGIRTEIHDLEREIRRRDWGDQGEHPHAAIRPLAQAPARAELAEAGVDACAYFHFDEAIHVLVCRRGVMTVERCLPVGDALELTQRVCADLRMRTAYERTPFTAALDASLQRHLAILDEVLLRPVRDPGRPLALVPCRAIGGLPWGLLPSVRGRPFTIARSISDFLGQVPGRPSRGPRAARMAALAGPRLGPVAEVERQAVAQSWIAQGDVITTGASSRADAQSALRRCDIVHLAAHGHHEARSPLFSWLDLSDGRLFAHELRASGVGAAHVVLAACDVGRSTVRPGEESLGFAATLLALGAQSVVAAQLPVPDETAAEVMIRYHAALAAGRGSDEALAEAVGRTGGYAGVFAAFGSRFRL